MSVRPERERPFLFDPDSPEYIKDLQRPAVIKEDLSEMERRKRVHEVLESKNFLRELESVIKNESEAAKNEPEQLKIQQRLSELTVPNRALSYNNIHNVGLPPIPIADLNNNENVSKQERIYRNKLACLCRLVEMFQWVQGFNNHASLRVPSENAEVLITPFGLLFHEMSASSILKVKPNGDIIDGGSSRLGVSQSVTTLHSAIHSARPDALCILQLHSPVVAAVASMNCGLLRVCHEAVLLGIVSCHDYSGTLDEEEEIDSIVKSLSTGNVLLLRNRGFIAIGETPEEVLYLAQNLVAACETQIRAVKAGITNLIQTDKELAKKTYHKTRNGHTAIRSPSKDTPVQYKTGEVEWEAWMRVLDHQSLKSGHLYKQPQLKPRPQLTQSMYITSDVAVPPSASSAGALDESDYESITAHKLAILRREQERNRWLNSPNAYQKIEILETNTDCPKRITKWVQDATSQSANGTPVKIVDVHHFSPMSANPKEFKERQQRIKESRLSGKTSAGPQSVILDASTYEDLRDIKPDVEIGPDRSVLIGTASKGIINRTQQCNAQVYRQLYAPNPFSAETDEEIQKYVKEIEMKSPKSRTPPSHLVDTSAETANPVDDYPNAVDSGRDSTFNSSRMDLEMEHFQPRATSTPKGFIPDDIKKSRSDKKKKKMDISQASTKTETTLSEDESAQADGKKKKKKGFFSFLRKKDR